MTIEQLIIEFLKRKGLTGLKNEKHGCSCQIKDGELLCDEPEASCVIDTRSEG